MSPPEKPVSLPDKVVAIDRALDRLPHAFGGALALAYYAEPRATIDIDINLFVPATAYDDVAGRLAPLGVSVDTSDARATVARDGQVRVFWGRTPLDLFFAYDRFHDAAARHCYRVPFAEVDIPILSATHLTVCKAVFARPKDWLDIETMLGFGTAVDAAEALRWVARIAGDTDPRYERLAALLTSPR